jgi:hypothetical protein
MFGFIKLRNLIMMEGTYYNETDFGSNLFPTTPDASDWKGFQRTGRVPPTSPEKLRILSG